MPMPPSFTTTFGQAASVRRSRCRVLEDLIALAGVDADAKRTADVVEHDQDVRVGAGEVGELQQLRVIEQAGLRRALGNVKQATEDTLPGAGGSPGKLPGGC